MKLKISSKPDAIKDSGGATFIGNNGVFDVTLNFVSIEETKGGAKQANFNVTYKGNDQVIYGPVIVNKDGQPNTIGMGLLNKLGVISGLADGDELDIEEESHKVGKDGKSQTFQVITNFSGLDAKLRVQREYTLYNNEIKRALLIRNVFRADGASASEIVNEGEIGKQLALELEKYSEESSYKDGVTPEQAAAWENAQRNAKTSGGSAPAPSSQVTEKRSGMFGG